MQTNFLKYLKLSFNGAIINSTTKVVNIFSRKDKKMKKIIALLLVLMMAMTFFISCNKTDDVDPDEGKTDDTKQDETTGDEDKDGDKEKEEVIVEVDNYLVVAFAMGQVGNDQKVSVSWNSDKELTKVEITVKHGEQTVATKEVTGDALKTKEAVVDAYYGKHTVTVKATGAEGHVGEISKDVAVFTDEYVIAPISGSMPQLYFTLYMNEITDNYSIPTFVWLARPDSWDWDNLPENVFAMPTVDKSEVLKHNNYDRMLEVTDAYIEELYSINPDSKFNLYINDYNAYLYMKFLPANGIAEENYTATLLSDGGASYSEFNKAFDSTDATFDADAKYADMASKLETLYTQVRANKDFGWKHTFSVNPNDFRQYSYVAAKEMDNVEWWILRPRAGVLCSPDQDFIDTVLGADVCEGVIEERNFAKPLTSMTDAEKETLKSFYNFNDEMFAEAEKNGKKAMMILGSWATGNSEPDFENYVKLVKAYYGEEEFVYYYKGHPNTPTSLYPDKQAQLEELGLIDVESSINAELILFFYPDIYMCGYNSSTFLSVESYEMACAMFNTAESSGAYADLIGAYITKIADPASSAYAALCTEAEHTYFLMEFNKDETKGAEIGIYDATAGTFKYYNNVEGSYVEVTTQAAE